MLENGVHHFKDSKGQDATFKATDGKVLLDSLKKARESQTPDKQWRVDIDHDADYYKDAKCFVTENGSTVAMKPNGDIISMCTMNNSGDKGKKLLEFAVSLGGKKLDSYDGNFEIYEKFGFEPVS